MGWKLKDIFESGAFLNDCRAEEGDDLESLKGACTPYLDEENRLPVQKFVPYTKKIQQTCFTVFVARHVRTKLSHNVIRARPSSPPKPGKWRKLLDRFLDFIPDIDIDIDFRIDIDFGIDVDVDIGN